MPKTPEQLANKVIEAIDETVDGFIDDLPKAQMALFAEITELSKDFIVPARTVKDQAHNLKIISKIDNQISKILITSEYQKTVDDYMDGFDEVTRLQNAYYTSVFTDFKQTSLMRAIQKDAMNSALDKLTGSTLHGEVVSEVTDILRRGMNSAKSYSALLSDVNRYVNGSDTRKGVLHRQYHALVNDTMNVYLAQYNQSVTDELGLQWYIYVGSLKQTSRPFCKRMIRSKDDCQPFIHSSQLNEIAKGHICGDAVSTEGMYKDTNGANILVHRGGYSCGHQFFPVSESIVPDRLKESFK